MTKKSLYKLKNIEHFTGWLGRSEKEARILYNLEKRVFFCSLNVHTLKMIRRRAMHS